MGARVGSGVDVAAVFSTETVSVTSMGWEVDVDLACLIGADVDGAGLAQADRNMTIATSRDAIRFMVPLFIGKTKGRTDVRPRHDMSLQGGCSSRRSNLLLELGIASGEEQERPRNDMIIIYRFNVLYLTRCGVKSLPNFSVIIVS